VVQVRLFGGVAATGDGGAPVDVGPAKCQAVLAALALSPRAAVPVARLIELVWGDGPPRTADKTLQSYVVRLRKGLGAGAIVRTGAAYRLEADPDDVDVARFQRRLAAAGADPDGVTAALAGWTGVPLAGLDAPGLSGAVEALVEQWLGALEVDLGRRVETDPAAAVGELTELTAAHPFREGLWALLMTALYRAGRQADALAAYRRVRQQLVENLGVEPGPRLRELEASILGHDERLRADRANGRGAGLPTGTVTFGFSDVEDSTRLWATHRAATTAAMARHDELVRSAVHRHGGYVFATGGDSFGVAFHRASDAAAWAVEMQGAIGREPWLGGIELRLRVGLHTGETQERGKGYFGPAVIVAARLAAAAHGGQTLVSGVTAVLLDRDDLRDLGMHRLDGVVAEQRVLQLGEGEHPPLRTEGRRRGNLPRRLGRLVGREQDLDLVVDALAASPIVTLVGPGGIGKTRLALAASRRFEVDRSGGAWLIGLAEIAASSDVARAVAAVLEVHEPPGRTLTDAIVASLGSHRALLVLDNCEHVVDGAADLARAVAEGCPEARVLATSREGLGVAGEQLVAVAPLDPAGAGVELFDERAAAATPSFDPLASRAEVEEICRRLDGVPLAIELAAARTTSLSPTDLVARLDDRLRLLTGGRRNSVERHRTMRATIMWSYDLLRQPEQVLFQRLSIFAGPFDLDAAGTVAADPPPTAARPPRPGPTEPATTGPWPAGVDALDVDDLLGGLVERSMVAVESGPFGRRFRLLETMRQFGAEHLSESGDTDLVAERHARWCLVRVTRIGEQLAGPAEHEGVARLAELWPNLRAAVDWACATRNRHLARALVRPVAAEIYVRSQSEIGVWAERILAITPPDDEEVVAFGMMWAARRYMRNMDRAGYERLAERYGEPDHPMVRYARAFLWSDYGGMARWAPLAVAGLRKDGDDHLADRFEIAGHGYTLLLTGRHDEHDTLLTRLLEQARAGGPPTALNWALAYLGVSASAQGREDASWRYFDEAAGVAVPPRTNSMTNPVAARDALRRGERGRAFEMLRSYVDELLELDNMFMAKVAAVEFVTMMARVECWPAAARMLDYLESSGAFGDSAALRTGVAEAAAAIAAHTTAAGPAGPAGNAATAATTGTTGDEGPGRNLDERQALTYIRTTLDRLLTAHA
jgi:predicted ATPase/DNA-binding SARP family transcriptional activator